VRYIRQAAVIFAVTFAGEVLHCLLPLPVPAGIYGLVILFLLLQTGRLPVSAVREAGLFRWRSCRSCLSRRPLH